MIALFPYAKYFQYTVALTLSYDDSNDVWYNLIN